MSRRLMHAIVLSALMIANSSDGIGQTGRKHLMCPGSDGNNSEGLVLTIDYDAKTMTIQGRDQGGNFIPTTTTKLESRRVTQFFDDRIVTGIKGIQEYTLNRNSGILRIDEYVGDHWYSSFSKPCQDFSSPPRRY